MLCFSSILRWKLRLLILNLSSFPLWVLDVMIFPLTTAFFLLFTSNLILLWLENIFDMTSIHLKLLKRVLCPSMRSVLDNGSCALKSGCILLFSEEKFSECQVKLVIELAKSSVILLLFFSSCLVNYCERSIEISNYNYWVAYFCYNYVRLCFIYLGTLFKFIYLSAVTKSFSILATLLIRKVCFCL